MWVLGMSQHHQESDQVCPPLSSQWHLQPFLFDSKSRFISTDGDADITTEKQNISSGLIAGL